MMTMNCEDQDALQALEIKLRTILPEEYQDRYGNLLPVSMGSAALKYSSDGNVAWNEMWGTFCDLAMAGGPPHKGTLLEPGSREQIHANSERYLEVVNEICRGIRMLSELAVNRSTVPGWVGLHCASQSMAEWLVRAILMENVSAGCEGTLIHLPAGPAYPVEKEIKNVITAVAKTSHYWLYHMSPTQHRAIGNLFLRMTEESPLIQPALAGHDFHLDEHWALSRTMAESIRQRIGLLQSDRQYAGWLGVEYPTVRAAIWIMRALVVSNVLARREETAVFVPVSPRCDPTGEIVVQRVVRTHRFAIARNVL